MSLNVVIRRCIKSAFISGLLLLTACQGSPVSDHPTQSLMSESGLPAKGLSTQFPWVMHGLENNSYTHTAADVAGVILETHLREKGVLGPDHKASAHRYAVTGEVINWHYTGSISPRPVVAVQLTVRDVLNDTVVWTDTAEGKGDRRESLSAFADELMASIVNRIPIAASGSDTESGSPDKPMPTPPGAPELTIDDGALHASGQLLGVIPMAAATDAQSLSGGLALRAAGQSLTDTLVNTARPLSGRSVAFYYAANPPVDVLSQFDRIVLEPDNITASELTRLTASGASSFAYVSIGEVGPDRAYASAMKQEWLLGKNPAWDSQVLDLSNPELRQFLVRRVRSLQQAGYDGVFLDTMDSFNLVARTKQDKQQQQAGLIALIKALGAGSDAPRIITNRGFEVLDEVAGQVEAVAAESLYASWNNEQQRYTTVLEADREWLLGKLNYVREALSLEVIAIDYLPPEQREQARVIASRIAEHGFVPWVANPSLDYIGVGALEVLPRKVLMIYNSKLDGLLDQTPLHKFVSMPVEYLGYVPEYLDLAQQSLPEGELKGRYAGVITWANHQFKDASAARWIQAQLDDAVPIVFLNMPPVKPDQKLAQALGLQISPGMELDSTRVSFRDDLIKPERSLSPRIDSVGLVAHSVSPANTVHMSIQDRNEVRSDVVVTGPFGGFAWQPGLVDDGLDYETYWVVDPFEFLQQALQLPDAPMPDVTSENGKRLWLAHIDGDALPSWAEMPGKQLGAEVIYDQILSAYDLPHTVSVVEAEMTEFPAYDDRREQMFDIARKTFALENVELASHTYSHPFKWRILSDYRMPGKYNLAISGYVYTPERDIAGSLAFIERKLAPPGKKTSVFLWSGDAKPGVKELAVLDRLGLPNVNGGSTSITHAFNTMTLVSPMAIPVGDYLQVYAPIMNENVYTNDWLGPFDGFKRVLETFELTEHPRRLKPVNVYYHFYSGTKLAAMRSLHDIYQWSLAQDIHPLHVSDFARKVPGFRQAGVARYLDGQWKVSDLGSVRSLRILGKERWPQLSRSRGVVGARQLHDGVYLHTNGAERVQFKTTHRKPSRIHLVSSNGQLQRWDNSGEALVLRISGEVPVSVQLGGAIAASCSLIADGSSVQGQYSQDNTVTFTFTSRDTGNAFLNCPA